LAIFVPPQHGKSELASRRFPAYALGKNPDRKIAIIGYEQTFTSGFNRDVQRIITSPEYHDIFPNTQIMDRNIRTLDTWLRNSDIVEVVGKKGSLRTVGIGGALTGNKVDIMIIDDPVKNMVEADSPTIQLRNYEWFLSVAQTRLHAESQILMLQTRWSKDDLAGKIFQREKDWHIINIPAIKENNFSDFDPRKIGEVLWAKQRTLETTLATKEASPKIFYCLHQQQPQASSEFLIFGRAKSCEDLPHNKTSLFALDWGFTNSNLAIVEFQIEPNKVYAKERLYAIGMTNPQLVEWINENLPKGCLVFCDSAEPKSIKELKDKNINAIGVKKFPNSVNTMILHLQSIDLHITKDSPNFIFEKENYQWAVGSDGKPTNTEIDKHNHLFKALMYGYWHTTKAQSSVTSMSAKTANKYA
jgi:hypothetical protein